ELACGHEQGHALQRPDAPLAEAVRLVQVGGGEGEATFGRLARPRPGGERLRHVGSSRRAPWPARAARRGAPAAGRLATPRAARPAPPARRGTWAPPARAGSLSRRRLRW